jgi:opacity protein-like surface antigen
MRQIIFATVVLLSFVPLSASAVDSGAYMGLGVATGSLNACPNGNCVEFTETAKESGHLRLIGGYDFNRFIGVEGGYSDFGSYNVKNTAQQVIGTVKGNSFSLAARGGYKFSFGLSLFAKLGLASVNTKYSAAPGWVLTGELNRHSTGLLFGLGAQYDFNDHLGIRLSSEATGFDDGAYNGAFGGANLVGILRF